MSIFDLIFLGSVLLALFLIGRMAVQAVRGRWSGLRRTAGFLGLFLVSYAIALVAMALARPRHVFAAGERKCFDDWCVAGISAEPANASDATTCRSDDGSRTWIATLQVSSDAKRVRQRARDAAADLEDREGHRYEPCGGPLGAGTGPPRTLSDELGPGESFRVLLPFRLPADARACGATSPSRRFPRNLDYRR